MKGRVISAETGQEIHDEPDPAAWAVQDGILGRGQLERTGDGVMTGAVTFPVRGVMPVVMTRTTRDAHGQWGARLRIGRDECDVLLFPASIAGMFDATKDKPPLWHGYIAVEGYTMRAEIGTDGAVIMHDSKRPLPLSAETLKALGEG